MVILLKSSYAQIILYMYAKVRFWRFFYFYTMKINLWSKFDNFVSL